MSNSEQQKQTKDFFEGFATQWSKNAKGDYDDFVNIVKIRNDFVIKTCKFFLKPSSKTLDVGCGTGDLVIELLKEKFDSIGIDFAQAMINQSQEDAKKQGFSEDRFIYSSILDYSPKEKFDLISANGLIEYISEKELYKFIENCNNLLNKKGVLVFESRNRLFNCFSINKYTKAEIEIGELKNLIDESIFINSCNDLNEVLTKEFEIKLKKNLHQHDYTGNDYANITVDVRYQYTPLEMIDLLKKNNFEIVDLYPVHIHGINPHAKDKIPTIHTKISYLLLEQKNVHIQLLPQSSSFMITAKKL